MMRKCLLAVVVSFLLVSLAAETASAQRRYQNRYRPSRPALSPYLNYFRNDTGLTDPYNTFVQPGARLQSTLQSQQFEISRLEGEVQRAQQGPPPTGVGAGFFNYSHYYIFRR